MSAAIRMLFTKNLLQRLFSALALIPVVLGAVWVGEWAYLLLVMLVCGVSIAEWGALTAPNLSRKGKIVIVACLEIVLLVAAVKGSLSAFALALLGGLLAGFYAVQGKEASGRASRALWTAAGVPYLALAGIAMLGLRNVPERGLGLTCYLLLVVWATDTGAYFAGRLIGGPKLLPKISPKKTWAGLIGGMAFAAVVGYGVSSGFDEALPLQMAMVAAVLAVVAQAGDFFESFLKRRAGAKDSGTLIPGHGGMLDRVDGILTAAMAFAAFVALRGL